MSQDIEHLRLLSVFHYVVAAITALFSFRPLFHLALGVAMVMGKLNGDGNEPFFCLVVAAIACACFPFGTVLGVFTILVLSRETVQAMFDNPAPPLPS